MTKISPTQEARLNELGAYKKEYDRKVADLEAALRARKYDLKAELSAKVREALDTGIPARQVAIKGLGYADVGSLKQYLIVEPIVAPVATSGEALPVPSQGTLPIVVGDWDTDTDELIVTDSTGAEVRILCWTDADGFPTQGILNCLDDTQDRDEIIALVNDRYPDMQWG